MMLQTNHYQRKQDNLTALYLLLLLEINCRCNFQMVFILRLCELAMLAKANEEQAAIGILPRRLRRKPSAKPWGEGLALRLKYLLLLSNATAN
jgi:hypothetical protein